MRAEKLIVAHRGFHAAAHENTVNAFQAAIDCGADMIETDVRRTADGELVLHHDEAIGGRKIADLTRVQAAQLSTALGYRLSGLDELLELAQGRIGLDIELKEADCEEALMRRMRDRGFGSGEFVVTSFDPDVIRRVHGLESATRTGLLVYGMPGGEALSLFHQSDAKFLAPDYAMLDPATLVEAEKAGVRLLPWTVNDPAAIRNLIGQPTIDGVVTDQPRTALAIRDGLGAQTL